MEMKPKIRCPACGSSQAYLRRKTGEIACPECGEVSLKKDFFPIVKIREVS